MARSAQSPYHPSVTKKAFRAKAKQEGMTFKAAIEARAQQLKERKFLSPARAPRRNPGRLDGVTWQGSSFISSLRIDGPTTGDLFNDTAADVELDWLHASDFGLRSCRDAPVIHSLLDITQPAKERGAAKGFEMIDGVRGVITLEDDCGCDGPATDNEVWSEVGDLEYYVEESDDDWEELYKDEHEKRSYAAVLKEK